MQPHQRGRRLISIALASILSSGCSDLPGVGGSAKGAIQINASVSGESIDLDPDGFTVSVDDGGALRLPATGLAVKDLVAGTHSVKIGGIAPNCSVNGSNPRTVEVAANDAAMAVSFAVECLPNVGSLSVSVVTTGEEISEKGYAVLVPPNRTVTLPANGTITISGVRVGAFSVGLNSIASNCEATGLTARATAIEFGKTTQVAFTVSCVASGRFQITTTTSGADLDDNGYAVQISRPLKGTISSVQLPANGTIEITGLGPGDYTLGLYGIANNCLPALPVLSPIRIASGNTTAAAFDITCAAAMQIAYSTTPGASSQIKIAKSNSTDFSQPASQVAGNFDPDWGPDGRLAFTSDRDGSLDIYTMDANGGSAVRLTHDSGSNYRPAWSPDGRKIAFVSTRDENPEIYVMDADGTNPVRLTTNPTMDNSPAWSPDGKRIAFDSYRNGLQAIWTMNADGSAAAPLLGTISGDQQPAWSPDGTKIALSRRHSEGHSEFRDIYLIDASGSATQKSVNYSEATDPTWSPDGSQLAYSATNCVTDSYYYYYSTCETDIILARTDGRPLPSSPVLDKGFNPAWRR